MKGKFFGLLFTDGLINVRVLESVEEHRQEGSHMHHCVFSASYYLNEESLIFSATINGERVETVEFSLEEFRVVQSRGVCNKNVRFLNLLTLAKTRREMEQALDFSPFKEQFKKHLQWGGRTLSPCSPLFHWSTAIIVDLMKKRFYEISCG